MPYPFEHRLSDAAIHRILDFVISDLPSELASQVRPEHVQGMRERARLAIREEESDRNRRDAPQEWLYWMERFVAHQLDGLEARISQTQEKSRSHLEQVMREQLGEVHGAIRNSATPCRFQSEGAAEDYMQLMTALPQSSAGPLKADSLGFLEALRAVARTGNVLVLVDPYALAETDDSGRVRSQAKEVHDLVDGLSLDKFVVYCRNDAMHKPCLDALVQKLGKKLEVRCGDLHDRYLLVGREGKSKSPFVELDDQWYGSTTWTGVAFGASLNGVSKRPTYVLKFEARDIPVVAKYLQGAAPSSHVI